MRRRKFRLDFNGLAKRRDGIRRIALRKQLEPFGNELGRFVALEVSGSGEYGRKGLWRFTVKAGEEQDKQKQQTHRSRFSTWQGFGSKEERALRGAHGSAGDHG